MTLIIKSGDVHVDYVSDIDFILRSARKLGLNTIRIPILINVPDVTAYSNYEINKFYMKNVNSLVTEAHLNGLNTILYPFVRDAAGISGLDGHKVYDLSDSDEPLDGFTKWKDQVLIPIMRDIAFPRSSFALDIGGNTSDTTSYKDLWIDIFNFCRSYFRGEITISRKAWNSSEELEELKQEGIFDLVDFVTQRGDFVLLSASTKPEEHAIKAALNGVAPYQPSRNLKVAEGLLDLRQVHNANVMFEFDYPALETAAFNPRNLGTYQGDGYDQLAQSSIIQAYSDMVSVYSGWITFGQISKVESNDFLIDVVAQTTVLNIYGDLHPSSFRTSKLGASLYSRLPEKVRGDDALQEPTPYPLKRFYNILSVPMDYLYDKISERRFMYNVDKTPAIFLPYLYYMLGFPFPSFMPESEQRSFLKILPELNNIKGQKRLFRFLGRTFYGSDAIINPIASGNKIEINLNVIANGELDAVDERTKRFIYFANWFRPVNRRINVVLTLFYSDEYLATPTDTIRLDYLNEENGEVKILSVSEVEQNTLIEVGEEVFSKSFNDDDHLDSITFLIADVETRVGTFQDSDSVDELKEPQNKLGSGKLGRWKLGGGN